MTPRLRAALPLRFAEDLLPVEFERLCCDLAAKEPQIDAAVLYGRLPQGQKGVDILMYHREGGGADVLQCKNYIRFTVSNLRKTIKEFEAAAKHWNGKGVRRFLLCIGCSSSDTELQNEILVQRQRLKTREIAFDVWDDAALTSKLTNDRAIALRHLDRAVADQICPPVESIAGTGVATTNLIQATLAECGVEFEESLEKELPRLRELARCGQTEQAFAAIEELRKSPRWPLLNSGSRVRALHLAASLHIDSNGDIEMAQKLMAEGRRISPDYTFQVIEAVIAFRQEGAAPALQILHKPNDVHAWNIRLAILVEDHQFEEVIQSVESQAFPPNGGSYRLASVAALLLRDIGKALHYSALAVRDSPNWFQVRIQAARMKYVEALLPHFPMLGHIAWPIPPDPEYVRRDAEAVACLEAAAVEFALLSQFNSDERQNLEAWHLACLANLANKSEETERLAATLLERSPNHLPVAVWCLQRNLPLNRDILFRALNLSDQSKTPDTAQALCQIHVQSGDFESALKQIDSARSAFTAVGADHSWRHLRAQLFAAVDRMDEAWKIVGEEPTLDQRCETEIAIARVQARRKGDSTTLARVAASAYEQTREPRFLMDAMEASLESVDQTYVLDNAENFLGHFPTSVALEIVLRGAFKAHRFDLYLRYLRAQRAYFSGGKTPMWVRRCEVESLWQTGKVNEAIAQAQSLCRESDEIENLFSLFAAQLAMGDFRGGVEIARKLVYRPEVSPAGLLYLAQTIYSEDLVLARGALKTAVDRGVHGNDLAIAVHLGFQMGVEQMVAPLMPAFCSLASRPNQIVQAFPLEEIKGLMQTQAQHRDRVWRVFGEGQSPVHCASRALNLPLAVLLREHPRMARESGQPWLDVPTLIRSGSRPPLDDPVVNAGDLLVDITALLFAADLDLLETVEKAFAPVLISPHVVDSLRKQIHEVSPHQPARQVLRTEILELVGKNEIRGVTPAPPSNEVLELYAAELGDSWCASLEHSIRVNGRLCDFTPPLNFNGLPARLSAEHTKQIVSAADVLYALQRADALSEEELAQAISRLGQSGGRFQTELALMPESPLLLGIGLAEVFAEAGVLRTIAGFLSLELTHHEVTQLRLESEGHQRRLDLVAWLKSLIDRVQRGLSTEVYRTFARTEGVNEMLSDTPEEKCLRDLLSARATGAKAVWCDDRWLSRYNLVDNLPNYGISEVLRSLRKSGHLSAANYFDALLRLRTSNARFIPLEKEELLYHLLRAPFTSQGLKETSALSTLRRYAAACALDRFRLHPPARDENGRPVMAEFVLATENQKAVAETIVELWNKTSLERNDRFTRAEWLLDEMFTPMPGFMEAHSGLPQPDLPGRMAAELALLFALGFSLPGRSDFSRERNHQRAQFYDWIEDRILEPLQKVAPATVRKLAENLERHFLKRDRQLADLDERSMRLATIRWMIDLPKTVVDVLKISEATRKWLGIQRPAWRLDAFGRSFEGAPFWRAVVSAAEGNASKVEAEDGTEYEFLPPMANRGPYRIPVAGPGLGANTFLVEPMLLALTGKDSRRRAYLERRTDWFDIAAEKFQKLLRKAERTRDSAERAVLIENSRSESAEHFYRGIVRRIRNNNPRNTDELLPPSIEAICSHLRMREESTFSGRASRLIREVGLASTIERFANLPITLPQPILDAVVASGANARRALVARLRRRLLTPLNQLHFVHLLAIIASIESQVIDEAKTIVTSLFESVASREQWQIFRALLEWVRRFFLLAHDFRQLDPAVLLSLMWLHAGRVHQMFARSRVENPMMRNAFLMASDAFGEVFDQSREDFWQDAVHPRRIGRFPVLLRGLGAALQMLPTPTADVLREQVCHSINSERLTGSAVQLLRDTSALPNVLGSFLGGHSEPILKSALGSDVLSMIMPKAPRQLYVEAFKELESQPESKESWKNLTLVAAGQRMPPSFEALLERFVCATDIPKLLRELQDQSLQVLAFLSMRCIISGNAALRDACEQEVFRRAQVWSLETAEEKLGERVSLIMGCISFLVVVPNNESTTHERLHKSLIRLVQMWPNAARVLKRNFSGWPTHAPLSCQRGLWELVVTLRAYCRW